MLSLVFFLFGLAIGSFVNVLALRYDGDHFLLNTKVIGGRSHCPHCKHQLRWFELVPVVSFFVQGGKCRHCKKTIGLHYPLVELLSGFIFVLVPLWLGGNLQLAVLWIMAFEILLLMTYIDIRLQLVPDELNVALAVVALFAAIVAVGYSGTENYSLLAPYAAPFGLQNNFWMSHLAGALFGAGFFVFLILVTRGKGMGWGDVKLGLPLGFLFGWPDTLFIYATAFVAGGIIGGILLALKRKSMKSALPFVPFLAASAAFVFFFGAATLRAYFHIMGL